MLRSVNGDQNVKKYDWRDCISILCKIAEVLLLITGTRTMPLHLPGLEKQKLEFDYRFRFTNSFSFTLKLYDQPRGLVVRVSDY